jgi:hypothetical protein
MSIFPVIMRELRAQARQPLTHWLRVAGGISVVGGIAAALWAVQHTDYQPMFGGPRPGRFQTFGTTLFSKMNLFIFTAIWIFVPLASADALSRERREGTLPLLYLTELRSVGIVVGKSFVHMLRAATLFVTMAPWLMLPLVFGGVDLRDLAMALLLDFTALLLAQAAGLLASTIPRDWLKSVILAELFALCLLLVMLNVHDAVLGRAVRSGVPAGLTPTSSRFWSSGYGAFYVFFDGAWHGSGMVERTIRNLEFTTNGSFRRASADQWFYGRAPWESDWQQIWMTLPVRGIKLWFRGVAGMVLWAAVVLLGAISSQWR